MKKTLFTREYESVKNTCPDSAYAYFPSDEDKIASDLQKECISDGGNDFTWFEGSALTKIHINELVIPQPRYTRLVYVQTMGTDTHPEGLLAILAKHQFTPTD